MEPAGRRGGEAGDDGHCARLYGRAARRGNALAFAAFVLKRATAVRRGTASMKLMSGNSNLPLVQAIADYLEMPITEASVRRFADEEIFVEIHENVRGEDVFVVQSTSYPANDNLMELLICIDALRRASAKRITAVLPYFGYARQDRKPGPAHADLGQAGRQPDHRRRRQPGAFGRSPCRPDPGLLRYPDRQSLRRAGHVGGHPGALLGPSDHRRLARRRRRGPRPRARQAARQRAARDRRQAARAAGRIRGDEHHRRRRRAASAS